MLDFWSPRLYNISMLNNKSEVKMLNSKYEVAEAKALELCQAIEEKHKVDWPTLPLNVYLKKGRKYIKIIRKNESQQCVWGFINLKNENFNVGDVLMAAGWNTPATNKARGNIVENDYKITGSRLYGPDYLK